MNAKMEAAARQFVIGGHPIEPIEAMYAQDGGGPMTPVYEYEDGERMLASIRAARNIMRRLLEDHPGDFPPAYQWLSDANTILGVSVPDDSAVSSKSGR